ncbi:hypothetical protein [Streptomyces lydicus]|uniref:hypothetical protein n=1 Tax=Streptomyces lydicus TaxID=47763 RepID=UPI00367D15FC
MTHSYYGILRIESRAGILVRDFREMLLSIENAYNGISRLYEIAETSPPHMVGTKAIHVRGGPMEIFNARREYGDNPIELDATWYELALVSAKLESPGFLEFLGALNPLECIRRYLCDRHARRQDKEYREPAEKRGLDAENLLKEATALKEWVAVLQQLGFSPTEIREVIEQHLKQPMRELMKCQDRTLIGKVELTPGGQE